MKLYVKDPGFYKQVAKIAIPIALQGLITTGVNMMDTIMVGMVSETHLSAVSLANQFINIFHIPYCVLHGKWGIIDKACRSLSFCARQTGHNSIIG